MVLPTQGEREVPLSILKYLYPREERVALSYSQVLELLALIPDSNTTKEDKCQEVFCSSSVSRGEELNYRLHPLTRSAKLAPCPVQQRGVSLNIGKSLSNFVDASLFGEWDINATSYEYRQH